MTDDLSVHIDYETGFSVETVKRVLDAFRSAIAKNWLFASDPRDPASLGLNVSDTEQLAQQIVQGFAKANRGDGSGSFFATFQVAFSPRAPLSLCVRVRLREERRIGVVLCVETETPMHIEGTWKSPMSAPQWLVDLERWGKVNLVPGTYRESSQLISMEPDERVEWLEDQERWPLSDSIWLTYEQELKRIVAALLEALPVEADQHLNVYLDCGKADVQSVVRLTLSALQEIIVENWRTLSALPPGFWPEYIDELGTSEIERRIADFEHSDQSSESIVEYFPGCCHQLYYDFSRDWKGAVTVQLSIPATALEEVEGSVERGRTLGEWSRGRTSFHWTLPGLEDMPPEKLKVWYEKYDRLGQTPPIWQKNRKHFLDVVERVKQVLRVQKFEMDPRIG